MSWTTKEREISRRLLLGAIGPEGTLRKQIIEDSGLNHVTLTRVIRDLRAEKLVYIGAWIHRTDEITGERKAGAPFAVYMHGDKPDVPRPKRLAKAVVQRKYQARNRVVINARKKFRRSGETNMFDQLMVA